MPGFSELDDDDAAELWDDAFRAMGRRVVCGDAALVQAARHVAEAGGGKGFDAVRTLLPRRAAIQRYIANAVGIDAAVNRLRAELGAPSGTADDIIAQAMGADLPRKALKDLLAALPTTKKSDAELAETLAIALADAPADHRFGRLRQRRLHQGRRHPQVQPLYRRRHQDRARLRHVLPGERRATRQRVQPRPRHRRSPQRPPPLRPLCRAAPPSRRPVRGLRPPQARPRRPRLRRPDRNNLAAPHPPARR